MGVPAFFRWLSRKFPSIVVDSVEEKPKYINGEKIPVDIKQPNPNGVEFDCLYLDMNGIIHPCCHPEDRPAPRNEDEMMVLIFEYIDRLMLIIRPRKLLYMAIDGVAPRAKMNQQRSRRFRSSKEVSEKEEKIREIRAELAARGIELPPEKQKGEHFDSNCITPGTPFMHRLAACLRFYIYERQNADPAWQDLEVILSDASVPGEGEHKIMDFIRRQRAQPQYNPNLHHVLCGADADLIMLGLATHEPHFTIIREEFRPDKPRTCEICNQIGHSMTECQGIAREKSGEFDEMGGNQSLMETRFIFLRLNVLREYLERELWVEGLPFPWSLERLIDDWVFLCFFVGNDFLPHLPSLEIREGAIDRLVRLYKYTLPRAGGYLTSDGFVNLDRVQILLNALGQEEDDIFRGRRDEEVQRRTRVINQRRAKKRRMAYEESYVPANAASTVNVTPLGRGGGGNNNGYGNNNNGGGWSRRSFPGEGNNQAPSQHQQQQRPITRDPRKEDNKSAAAQLKWQLLGGPQSSSAQTSSPSKNALEPTPPFYAKRKLNNNNSSADETSSGGSSYEDELEEEFAQDDARDGIKLWEEGWRERYYQAKFAVEENVRDFGKKVAREYVRGLSWVLLYYYQGCPSWKWYFPYHYAPFASDMTDITTVDINFTEATVPFRPLEQLMAVFPASSRKFLPVTWQQLMFDAESPIIDLYPVDFAVDLNGKKFAWQGVALLPFVDEERLLATLKPLYADLTPQEIERNSYGYDRLFVHKQHKLYDYFMDLYSASRRPDEPAPLDPELAGGFQGLVWCDELVILENETVPSPFTDDVMPSRSNNQVCCAKYKDPQYQKGFVFQARLINGVRMPRRVVKPQDWDDRVNGPWRPVTGFSGESSGGGQYARDPQAAQRMIRHNIDYSASAGGQSVSVSYQHQSYQQRGHYGGGGKGPGGDYYPRNNNYNNNNNNNNGRGSYPYDPRQSLPAMPFLIPPPPPRFPMPPGRGDEPYNPAYSNNNNNAGGGGGYNRQQQQYR